MRFVSVLFAFICISVTSLAQTTDQSLTIEQYVTDVLVGDGVNVSNITYLGGEEQLDICLGLKLYSLSALA